MTATNDGPLTKAQIVTSVDDDGAVTVVIDLGLGIEPALMVRAAPLIGRNERALALIREAAIIGFQDLMTQHGILSVHTGDRKTK